MSNYMEILQKIESGEITSEEGISLIQNLDKVEQSEDKNHMLSILEKLDAGEISADDAVKLMEGDGKSQEQGFDTSPSQPPNIPEEELEKWKTWWSYPFYIGMTILLLSAFWMYSTYPDSMFWFVCAWFPFLIGLLFVWLSLRSREGPWIHVRVRGPREKVSISIPAPLKITGWALRNFGHLIPKLNNTAIDEVIMALDNVTKAGNPLYVHVDEGDDGEQVEVFIG